MTAREIMTENPEVIDETESVMEAAKRLARLNVGSIPICKAGVLRGMLTDRDIVTKVVAVGKDPSKVRAIELETTEPVTIRPGDSIETAMHTMIDFQVRRLPVIDGEKLVGMLSQGDLAKALSREQAGEMLAALSI